MVASTVLPGRDTDEHLVVARRERRLDRALREQVDPAVRGFELAEQADTVDERVFERVLAGRQVLGDEDGRPVGRCALRVYHAVAGRGERDSVARGGQGGQHPFVSPYTDRDGLYDAACGDGDGGVALLEGADTSPPPP